MPKRFTATEKWTDPWFTELTQPEQLFWIYLLDNCDLAGIWSVNWRLVKFHIQNLNYQPEKFNGRVVELNASKWFIPKFIQFQYGELYSTNRMHLAVIHRLEKEGAYKGHLSPLQGAKDKDKDKDSSKDVREKRSGEEGGASRPNSQEEVSLYAASIGFKLEGQYFMDYQDARGWKLKTGPIKNWKAVVRTWKRRWEEEHGSHDSPSRIDVKALAREARLHREAEKARKDAAPGPVSPSVRDLPDVQSHDGGDPGGSDF